MLLREACCLPTNLSLRLTSDRLIGTLLHLLHLLRRWTTLWHGHALRGTRTLCDLSRCCVGLSHLLLLHSHGYLPLCLLHSHMLLLSHHSFILRMSWMNLLRLQICSTRSNGSPRHRRALLLLLLRVRFQSLQLLHLLLLLQLLLVLLKCMVMRWIVRVETSWEEVMRYASRLDR